MDRPTELSFCAGYDGIGIGLRNVLGPCRTLAYVEIEAFACANLVAKMETGELDSAPIWTDLKTFPSHIFRGCVDILTGGYPCQPFSAAGKRLGEDDPRHLWPYIREAVDAIQPRFCFFENVEGHVSLGLSDVLNDLGRMGYRTTAGLFSAEEVGAPHQRKRVFILAHSGSGILRVESRWIGWTDGEGAEVARIRGQGMADTSSSRRREAFASGSIQGEESHPDISGWPSRPGEPQYEWEEPRTVANTKNVQRREVVGSAPDGVSTQGKHDGSAEPGLGRAASRSSSRVDRLRLLGNGVVPATAARAWCCLMNELMTNEKEGRG